MNTSLGPPSAPSSPRLMDITAVSIRINWTAGFNGGMKQTFTVYYQTEGSDTTYAVKVTTDPDVNKGDIVMYKLTNSSTIKPMATYNVWIRAENSFGGFSFTEGNPASFTTLGKLCIVWRRR